LESRVDFGIAMRRSKTPERLNEIVLKCENFLSNVFQRLEKKVPIASTLFGFISIFYYLNIAYLSLYIVIKVSVCKSLNSKNQKKNRVYITIIKAISSGYTSQKYSALGSILVNFVETEARLINIKCRQ